MSQSRRPDDAFVWINPAVQGGAPCIGNPRIPTEQIAKMVLSGIEVGDIERLHQLDHRNVLIACWYEATHSRRKMFRRAWGEWAREAGKALWYPDGPLPSDPTEGGVAP